MVQEDKTI